MYSEYEKYILRLRDNLIRCGIGFSESISQNPFGYYDLFKLSIKLDDIIYFYKILALSESKYGLNDFLLPLDTSYNDMVRSMCYDEFLSDILPLYKKLTGYDSISKSVNVNNTDKNSVVTSSNNLALEVNGTSESTDNDVGVDDYTVKGFSKFFEDSTGTNNLENSADNDEDIDYDKFFEDSDDTSISQGTNIGDIQRVSHGVILEEVTSVKNKDFSSTSNETNSKSNSGETERVSHGVILDDYLESDDDSEESDYGSYSDEDDDDGIVSNDYSEDEESDYSSSSDDEEESDYSSYFDESDESDYDSYSDEGDEEESDYGSYSEDEEESDYGSYSDDEDEDSSDKGKFPVDESYKKSNVIQNVQPESKGNNDSVNDSDLGTKLQDTTNAVLTKVKRRVVSFLSGSE